MKSDEIRTAFLKYFEEKGHKVIPSSSLIPKGDPTLLLTTAGMVQVKPYFLGEAKPPGPRLASCQKCFRTTDIESVGDATHLTFFEMLGNFSVGDYFKQEAIAWAWEFVTERMKIATDKLWVTIYLNDDESFGHWRAIGVPEEKIIRCGEADNFWGPAGSSGPCGPCSEIHYDFGEETGCGKPDCKPNCECGRFTELWNLVFTQYNQDEKGKRTPLPKPNIDTGMGLERLTAVMQGKATVYDTDLFAPLLDKVAKLTGKKYGANSEDDAALRVVAEHGRALAFLIADGVNPANEGRGYVLRRLLRRAQYFSETLAYNKPVLVEVAKETINKMGNVYPELVERQEYILEVIKLEIWNFQRTLPVGRGMLNRTLIAMREALRNYFPIFERAFTEVISKRGYREVSRGIRDTIEDFEYDCTAWQYTLIVGGRNVIEETLEPVKGDLKALNQIIKDYDGTKQHAFIKLKHDLQAKFKGIKAKVELIVRQISGLEVFVLHDTYGFPVELTKEIVEKTGFGVDMAGFEKEMNKQRERAREAHKFVIEEGRLTPKGFEDEDQKILTESKFTGHHSLSSVSKVLMINLGDINRLEKGDKGNIILAETPFYGEMGGQVGDTGEILSPTGRFKVTNTTRILDDIVLHQGEMVEGHLSKDDEVTAVVDIDRRRDIARNHTATHLLQAALKQVLGEHIQQRGSLVAPERLRFDFSHLAAMTPDEIKAVQRIVNEKIRENLSVYDDETSYQEAIAAGVTALFDEKYGDVVRVLSIGEPVISAELCGGTHVASTGEIGYFHIVSEGSIGAGLRRIEAVTGREAERLIEARLGGLEGIAQSLEATPETTPEKVEGLLGELDKERKRVAALEKDLARKEAESLLSQAVDVKGVNVLTARVASASQPVLREMADYIRGKLGSVIVVLGAVSGDRPVFIAAVTPDLVKKGYNAGDIVKKVSQVTGGGGGGRPDFAQAGGRDKGKLEAALRLVKDLV